MPVSNGEEEFHFEESEGEDALPTQKGRWEAVKLDHHGYQIKHDALNNTVLYDDDGYLVAIDEEGNHKKYDADGHEVRIVDGRHLVYDKDGNQLINGKPHDERGY